MELFEERSEERLWVLGLFHWLGIAVARWSSRRTTTRFVNADRSAPRGLKPVFCVDYLRTVVPGENAGDSAPSPPRTVNQR